MFSRFAVYAVVAAGSFTLASSAAFAQAPAQMPAPASGAAAQNAGAPALKVLEFSNETRLQMDYHVAEAALAALLPTGYTSAPAATGPAKDCNLRVIFIDRVTINGPDGRPVGKGSNHFILLAAPAKDPSGANVQVVVGGLTEDPADAPGAFGSYLVATTHSAQHTTTLTANAAAPVDTQDWTFAAATGERIEMHIKYDRGVANHGQNPQRATYVSAKTPSMSQIWVQENVLDIMRNVTTNPTDKVKEYTFKAGGGSFAKLFDGTEKPLSWDNVLWLNRTVALP